MLLRPRAHPRRLHDERVRHGRHRRRDGGGDRTGGLGDRRPRSCRRLRSSTRPSTCSTRCSVSSPEWSGSSSPKVLRAIETSRPPLARTEWAQAVVGGIASWAFVLLPAADVRRHIPCSATPSPPVPLGSWSWWSEDGRDIADHRDRWLRRCSVPSLFIGAALSASAFGLVVTRCVPGTSMVGAYGLIGMGGLRRCCTRPITAVVMMFGTHRRVLDHLPLMAAIVIAQRMSHRRASGLDLHLKLRRGPRHRSALLSGSGRRDEPGPAAAVPCRREPGRRGHEAAHGGIRRAPRRVEPDGLGFRGAVADAPA